MHDVTLTPGEEEWRHVGPRDRRSRAIRAIKEPHPDVKNVDRRSPTFLRRRAEGPRGAATRPSCTTESRRADLRWSTPTNHAVRGDQRGGAQVSRPLLQHPRDALRALHLSISSPRRPSRREETGSYPPRAMEPEGALHSTSCAANEGGARMGPSESREVGARSRRTQRGSCCPR